jgi:hypothetical protein
MPQKTDSSATNADIEKLILSLSGRDPASEATLAKAFKNGGWELVRSLHRGGHSVPYERCWIWAEDWCLSYDEVL